MTTNIKKFPCKKIQKNIPFYLSGPLCLLPPSISKGCSLLQHKHRCKQKTQKASLAQSSANMDPSHDNKVELEETEEFSSNESGWTKYIASPDPEHNFSSDVDDGDEADHDDMSRNMDNDDVNDDDDDHDSIASDASSGPAHHTLPSEVGTVEGGEDEDEESCNYYTVAKKKEAKEKYGKARNNEANRRPKIPVKKNRQADK
ncbi:hypothetical protein Drorol1_Dr00022328 [Drosera rotundifolia]